MSEPSILRSTATAAGKCRCGTRISPGERVFRIASISSLLESLFRDQVFCSPQCIHMYFLESLETVDSIDTPDAESTVSDLHELHEGLSDALAALTAPPP